jgi:hypothetical protein
VLVATSVAAVVSFWLAGGPFLLFSPAVGSAQRERKNDAGTLAALSQRENDAGTLPALSPSMPPELPVSTSRYRKTSIHDFNKPDAQPSDGSLVCTCGVVVTFGSGPDHNVNGTKRAVLNSIIIARDATGEGGSVVCFWLDGPRPHVTEGKFVCARGRYEAPTLGDCELVKTCD